MGNVNFERITKENSQHANQIMHEIFNYVTEEEQNFFNPYEPNFDTAYIENYYIKVGRVIAGICGYYIPKEDDRASWQSWLAIYPYFRNKGLAEKAVNHMNYISSRDKGVTTFRVYTSKDNMPALNLYEKCGYVREPQIHDVAIVLTKGRDKWLKEPIW